MYMIAYIHLIKNIFAYFVNVRIFERHLKGKRKKSKFSNYKELQSEQLPLFHNRPIACTLPICASSLSKYWAQYG